MKSIALILSSLLLASCASIPTSIKPVEGFELERYVGQWYEIARLDHRFERGLEQVTANYTLNEDGTVSVVNRGFSTDDQQWEDAQGKARFKGPSDIGHLEVSFFGPFYGDYVIFELDKEGYQYAFITGSENSLWLLSRTPVVSQAMRDKFIKSISNHGYSAEELIFVRQEQKSR